LESARDHRSGRKKTGAPLAGRGDLFGCGLGFRLADRFQQLPGDLTQFLVGLFLLLESFPEKAACFLVAQAFRNVRAVPYVAIS
jgi:hypothetical protein